ncbi:hypothetical protein CsSME_00022591 [Camellia sinensis var. sinensis]
MRRAFRIEAVGLMSLWFSFGSGVLACFVVEWESGKEGSTMHVSPDQLLPHTKIFSAIWVHQSDGLFLWQLPDQRRSSPSPDSSRLRATPFEAQSTPLCEPVVSRNPLSSLLLTDDKDGLPYKDKENPCLCSLVLGMLLLVF